MNNNNTTNITSLQRSFTAADYSITISMLAISTFIGVYFGFWSKAKPKTTIEYLIGNRKIGLFPIAMSLAASCITASRFLAQSTDVYKFGTQITLINVSSVIASFCSGWIFIPVLYNLNTISSYEYFKLRFNNVVRTFGSFLFVLKMLFLSATTIYGPCIVLAQVSGINIEVIIPCISAVVIFYTSIGGLKAVVLTDTLQMILMIVGAFSVMIIGINKAGGIENVWEENEKAGKITFLQMKYDPSVRYTFWDLMIGMTVHYMEYLLVNQSMTQRCLSLPSYKKAKLAIIIYCIIGITISIVCSITALSAFAMFHSCDPITSKQISKDDQIMPYFMMNITENIPVIPGIYLSAIFSASLSTVSTGLNSMAGVILIDFIRSIWKKPISDAQETLIMKIIVLISGIIFVSLVYLVDQLGDIMQTAFSLPAIASGPLLGIFMLGMLFPWANSKGALAGGVSALALLIWINTGAQLNRKRMIKNFETSLSIDGCDNNTLGNYYSYLNKTKAVASTALADQDEIFPLYKIPFLYYDMIGVITVLVVGLSVSFLTRPNNPKEMDPKFFPSMIRKFCKKEGKSAENVKLMKNNKKIDCTVAESAIDAVVK